MPSRLDLRSLRPSWPLALLLAAIGVTTLAAVDAHRTVRSHRATAERALRDYASFAAWSFQERLRGGLAYMARETLGPVNHGEALHAAPGIPDASSLPHYLDWDERCACHRARYGPTPARYFGFAVGSDTVGVALNTNIHPERGWLVDGPPPPHAAARLYDARERRWLNDTLTAQVRRGARSEWGFQVVVGQLDARPRWLVYTLMPTTRGDTILYGVEYTAEDVRAMMTAVLRDEGILPPTFAGGRPAEEMLSVEVMAAGHGPVLFTAGARREWRLDATQALPASYGGMVVHAQVRPELVEELVIGGLPRSRLPQLLGLLALAAALATVAALQLRREHQIARMRAEFVASVSHELRTPLAQMRLSLETLRLGRFRTEAQRQGAVEHADREVRRLSSLVENLLRFGRGGTPEPDPTREPCDAAEETRDVAVEFAPLATTRRATIEVAVEGPLPTRLRPGALRQILLNLLDNAVKYGPAGQVVQVRASRSGDRARIEVRDQGEGVAPAERDLVWQPFRRGSGAMRAGAGGSGIGLTVVRDIVAEHGGRAWFDVDAEGSLVVVELPLAADAPRPVAPAAEGATA